MATSMVSLTSNTWKLVSTVSVSFQIPEQSDAYAVEATVIPTTLDIRKKIIPGKIYSFTKTDGNLYMYSQTDIDVAIDPIV